MLMFKDGLRYIEESLIMEQLIKNGVRYMEKYLWEKRVLSEFYNELFFQIFYLLMKVLDYWDLYSFVVQILVLVKVLVVLNMWIDFLYVEWRIRLGQLLWGNDLGDEVDDGVLIGMGDLLGDIFEERYWLLMQILLVCELFIRLDVIMEGDELGVESI